LAANDEDLLELKYDSASRRRSRIAAMITDHGFCTITELATAFDVSDMTVRRDILKLTQSDRTLRIVHGGIRAVPLWEFEGTDYRTRAMHNRLVKQRIAAEVVKLMVPGSTVALDSGTTGIAIAEAIPADSRLNVVTQSLPAANALASKEELEVSVLGGTLIRSMQAFVGPGAIAAIAGLRINTFFLSATSIDERGVLAGNEYDAATKRAFVDAADTVILVSDSSKFSLSSRFRTCPLSRVSMLVTDSGISPEQRAMMELAGVRVIIAAGAGERDA
jgi:DeoR family transcriptional regulator, aga operon transcriptional repressor